MAARWEPGGADVAADGAGNHPGRPPGRGRSVRGDRTPGLPRAHYARLICAGCWLWRTGPDRQHEHGQLRFRQHDLLGGYPVTDAHGGHVGTNGNMHEQGGQTIVKGSLSTPRSGVGTCQAGAITAVSVQSGAQISEGIIKLPQAIAWPPPEQPSPMPPTTTIAINGSQTCADVPITWVRAASPIRLLACLPSRLIRRARRWCWATSS